MDVATSRLPKDRIEGLDDDRASRFAKWLAATWQSGLLPRPRLDTVRSKAAELAKNASDDTWQRSEEHTSELQSRENLVCRLLLEKKKQTNHHSLMYRKQLL